MSEKTHKMENRKLVFLPGGLAHGPYQVEGKGGASWNVPLASPILPVWFPRHSAQGSPSQAAHMEGGKSLQTGTGQVSWRSQPQFVPYMQWAGRGNSRVCVLKKSRCPRGQHVPGEGGGARTSLDFQDLS